MTKELVKHFTTAMSFAVLCILIILQCPLWLTALISFIVSIVASFFALQLHSSDSSDSVDSVDTEVLDEYTKLILGYALDSGIHPSLVPNHENIMWLYDNDLETNKSYGVCPFVVGESEYMKQQISKYISNRDTIHKVAENTMSSSEQETKVSGDTDANANSQGNLRDELMRELKNYRREDDNQKY